MGELCQSQQILVVSSARQRIVEVFLLHVAWGSSEKDKIYMYNSNQNFKYEENLFSLKDIMHIIPMPLVIVHFSVPHTSSIFNIYATALSCCFELFSLHQNTCAAKNSIGKNGEG